MFRQIRGTLGSHKADQQPRNREGPSTALQRSCPDALGWALFCKGWPCPCWLRHTHAMPGEACMLSSCHERPGLPWEVEPRIISCCSPGSPGPQRRLFWEGMHSWQHPGNEGQSVGWRYPKCQGRNHVLCNYSQSLTSYLVQLESHQVLFWVNEQTELTL